MDELSTASAASLAPDVHAISGSPDSQIVDRDVRTTPREKTLAQYIYDVFVRNERFAVEEGFHDQMRESWRICRSEFTEEEKRRLEKLGIPTDVHDPIVEVRKFAALSQLQEIFSTSGNFPAKLTPTSSPTLPGYITEEALNKIINELVEAVQMSGVMPSEQEAAEFGRARMDELLNSEREHAHDEIDKLERRVRDDFEEANYINPFNCGMDYLTVFGTALWEGPVPCIRWGNEWSAPSKNGAQRVKRKAKPGVAFRAVNPIDVYPSPDQTEVTDGDVCIRVRFPPQELWLNTEAGLSSAENGIWFRDTIQDLLAKYPTGGVRLTWQDGEAENRELRGQSVWMSDESCMMEGISFYGQVRGNLLNRMGVFKTDDGKTILESDYYEVNAIVIDEFCVYCRIINPSLGRPLFKAQFYQATDRFFGESIAQRLIGYQRVMNGSLHSLIVNMNMTAAPQLWLANAAQLLDKTPDRFKMMGGKIWAFKQNIAGVATQSGPPMGVLRVDSRINDILAVMNMVTKRVDDVSGIPSYTYGQNVTGGAGRTYSGLALLSEAAGRVIKMIIDHLCNKVLIPQIKMDAYRLMIYENDMGYTGDIEVIPVGPLSLVNKQQEMQKVLQLMQTVASNQYLVQTVGSRGLMELFRLVLETFDIPNIDRIIPSKSDLDLKEYVAKVQSVAQAQASMNQAQAPQMSGPTGDMAEPRNLGEEYAGNPQPTPQQGSMTEGGSEFGVTNEPNPGSANERRSVA